MKYTIRKEKNLSYNGHKFHCIVDFGENAYNLQDVVDAVIKFGKDKGVYFHNLSLESTISTDKQELMVVDCSNHVKSSEPNNFAYWNKFIRAAINSYTKSKKNSVKQ